MKKLKIIYKKLEELIPYANNPRDNINAVDKVAASIKNYGFKVPIVIDKNNEIIAGHTRFLSAQELKLNEVPCIIAEDLTEAQIKGYRIADNKVSEFSEWDYELLNIEFEELKELDFDLELTGFNMDEIDLDLDYNSDNEDAENSLDDDLEVVSENFVFGFGDFKTNITKKNDKGIIVSEYAEVANVLSLDETLQQKGEKIVIKHMKKLFIKLEELAKTKDGK